ncbi:hypothetical protein TorRG33x02_086850 [Trema orientale]|uniref:DUF1985 domain-containing protein n=1 Tax=Trema orientale TaxID=63057 RepID=A0A2P5FCN6_TREOI|nr:hypothetical protein TorRG33x02_086850 [Trema orientale]
MSRFSIDEFASITNLKYDNAILKWEFPKEKKSPRIKELYFPTHSSVSKGNLLEFFKGEPQFLCDEDAVKLAQLLVVECVLLSKRPKAVLDDYIMRLVDDQDRFNDYSWGLRSYNDTIGYLHKAIKFKTPNECNSVTYELCGFPLVFQPHLDDLLTSIFDSKELEVHTFDDKTVDEPNLQVLERHTNPAPISSPGPSKRSIPTAAEPS